MNWKLTLLYFIHAKLIFTVGKSSENFTVIGWVWWDMPVIPAFVMQRQEDLSLRPVCIT